MTYGAGMTWDGDALTAGDPADRPGPGPRRGRPRGRGRGREHWDAGDPAGWGDRDDEPRGGPWGGGGPGGPGGGWGGGPWGGGRGPRGPRGPLFLPVFVAIVQVAGTRVAEQHAHPQHPLNGLGFALLLLGPACLLFRGRWPTAVCAGTSVVAAGYLWVGFPYGPVFLSVVVAFVGAVLAGHRRAAWLSGGGLYAVQLAVAIGTGRFQLPAELGLLAWLLLVVLAAEVVRTRSERREQWRQARAEREQRIVDEQRIAVARELHDVLAHSISLINVQAGVALELLDGDPEQARTALTTIKRTSKDALGEVRQVLGTLRAPGSAAPRAPEPGLDRLDELVRQAAAVGLTVSLLTEGEPVPLPQGVGLAAFRIVQEALTNVIRHSSARTAEVVVAYQEAALVVRVADPGPLSATGGPRAGGSGSGLAGMRERAAALGGSLSAGPGPQAAGFQVRAELPFQAPRFQTPRFQTPREHR
jgi:signal transduction histidine kinase